MIVMRFFTKKWTSPTGSFHDLIVVYLYIISQIGRDIFLILLNLTHFWTKKRFQTADVWSRVSGQIVILWMHILDNVKNWIKLSLCLWSPISKNLFRFKYCHTFLRFLLRQMETGELFHYISWSCCKPMLVPMHDHIECIFHSQFSH